MKQLLNKIDQYLLIQEKKENISLSLSNDINDIIEMVKKSDNKDDIISMLNKDVKEQIKKLIEGGIL